MRVMCITGFPYMLDTSARVHMPESVQLYLFADIPACL